MAITAIVSFTNMWLRPITMASSEHPDWDCNMCSADSGETVWRDLEIGLQGERSKCCNMWVPWCDDAGSYPTKHITLTDGNEELYAIWQHADTDGDYVRYSTNGYAKPGTPIPGSASVDRNRDCGLTVYGDGTLYLWDRDPDVKIPDLPMNLHMIHMDWHKEDYEKPHTGRQFLDFHRDFLKMFHNWYDKQPFADQSLVAGWPTLPPEFLQPGDPTAAGYFARVRDLETNHYKWATSDQFGEAVKGSLHNWLHNIPITTVYRDTLITNFSTAPDTRNFYRLHGMIDTWWQRWMDGQAAQFVSQQGIPTTIQIGQPFTVTVTMQNTGHVTWPAGGSVQLGSQDPQDNMTWGVRRVAPSSDVMAPVRPDPKKPWQISAGTFRINATAPRNPGKYTFQWQMVDGATWFGDVTPPISITVRLPPDQTVVPHIIGLEPEDAANKILAADLTPAPTGSGTIVTEQKPAAGTQVARGSKVTFRVRPGKRGS